VPARGENISDLKTQVATGSVNNPLRPQLYSRLMEYAHGNVVIANEGEEMDFCYVIERGKPVISVNSPGEYYRISCPFCTDTRKRLWINHRWGLRDEKGRLNLFLAICYNENCLAAQGRAWQFYQTIFTEFIHDLDDPVHKNHRADSIETKPEWPGRRVMLDEIWPNHPVRLYLQDRGYTTETLSRDFGVCYCMEAADDYRMAQGRIIIPIFMKGELKGWQARLVGDQPHKSIPKYYSMPGMKKTKLLYNFDQACKYPHVVLCEGPTDVWTLGPEAVALFGKTVSDYQLGLVVAHWKTVYVCLDGEAIKEGQDVFDKLTNKVDKGLVRLPLHSDPGSLPTATLREMVFSTQLVSAGA